MEINNSSAAMLHILLDSLEKKYVILTEIENKTREQEELLKKEDFSFKDWDALVETKAKLIGQLPSLDQGFETVYGKLKSYLLIEKDRFKVEINRLQNLIQEIMSKSSAIEALENRNKISLEDYFHGEKKEIYRNKSSFHAAAAYQNHTKSKVTVSQSINTKR